MRHLGKCSPLQYFLLRWYRHSVVHLVFLFVSDIELWVIEQNPIPYMWQVILSYVPVKGRIVDPYHKGLFGGLARLCSSLPTMLKSSTNVLWSVLDWWSYSECGWRCLKMFIEPLSKGSGWLPSILFITGKPAAFVPVYYSTLCWMFSLSLDVTRMFYKSSATFKMCLHALFFTYIFDAFT